MIILKSFIVGTFVEKFRIRVVESCRTTDPFTKNVKISKKIIKNIGPVSKFDDGKPDFIERLKTSFNACDPIIDELKPFVKKDIKKDVYNLKIFQGTDQCVGHPKLIANLLFEKLLDVIDVDQLIRTYKQHYGVSFDVYGFFKLMLFGRILNPASKISTVNQNSDYYTPIIKDDFYKFNVYDTLDFIAEHRKAIFNRINSKMITLGRTTNYLFYDCTNFFFETEEQDDLRKTGVSKEERSLPLVQMGLIMDEQGIPISIEQFPGNTLDHLTVKKSLENTIPSINNSRYIFIGDKGFAKSGSAELLLSHGNGYIFSKSVRGSTKDDKAWMLTDDFSYNSDDFKCKSRIVKKSVKLANGTSFEYSEKQVTYWSKKFYDREIAERQSFYEVVKKIIENPNNFKITKLQYGQLTKYLDKKITNTKTGEIIDGKDLLSSINMTKLKEDYKLLGFYTIITSETNMSDTDIINKYHELTKIEDQFRVMKSTLDTRPIFLRTPNHILAHLSICTIALILIRIIQKQIKTKHPKESFNVFYDGLSADRIQTALNKFKVEMIDDVYYRFNDIDDKDLKLILESFDIQIEKKLYKLGELKQLKQSIKMST